MAILLGLASALTYGAADFLGGLASRRARIVWVLLVGQGTGLALLLLAFPLLNDGHYTRDAIVWGTAAGVAGIAGVAALFKGLATGKMSVVAPVTGVEAAAIPVVFGLLTGERPHALALVGVCLALVAVALVSLAPDAHAVEIHAGRVLQPGVAAALVAGAGFGAFFILLERAGEDSGMWPLVAGRVTTLAIMVVAALILRTPLRPGTNALGMALGAGMLDVTANTFFLLATRFGLLSIVAVLTSLYPASTVLLARLLLKERLARPQLAGLACAGAGVVLIGLA